MSLSIGIVGLPNVGKSTLFKALTRHPVDIQNYPFCTINPNVGVVAVPDTRVDRLSALSHSKKKIYAAVEFVDIAGLVKGAAEGEGLGNKFLSHIREVDAILEVVRVFRNGDVTHVHSDVDPRNDVAVIETELLLADLETATKRLTSLTREVRSGDKEAVRKEKVFLKIRESLEKGEAARDVDLTDEEKILARELHLLTIKPLMYVYNVSRDNVFVPEDLRGKNHVSLDLKTEGEIADLTEEESQSLGFESGAAEIITEAYAMLGLQTFFTTGEDETRAWTTRVDATAPEAGAVIHTDFSEKFVRAEVINWQRLLEAGSYAAARERGWLRLEGKNYVVKDGDVIEFKI